MNKCWFILQQSCYTPPEYANSSKAGGKTTGGDLRLGDVVPSPQNIFPILTQGTLPIFSAEMRITSTRDFQFDWQTMREQENSGTAGAGLPIAGAVSATVDAALSTEFKKTMKSWANFSTLDTEKVQPSRSYIGQVLAQVDVADHINQQGLGPLDRWTVFVVTGLMIARAGGSMGASQSKTNALGVDADVDVSGVFNAGFHGSHKNSTENNVSHEFQGDRIWAVRFAKIHKGLLRRRWMQTEETIGASLGAGDEEEEQIAQVLKYEGMKDFKVIDCKLADAQDDELSLVRSKF